MVGLGGGQGGSPIRYLLLELGNGLGAGVSGDDGQPIDHDGLGVAHGWFPLGWIVVVADSKLIPPARPVD